VTAENIPSILKESFALTEDDRKLLNTLADNAPVCTTQLYYPIANFNGSFLSVNELAEKLDINESDVRARLEHIRSVWSIPKQEKLPTNNKSITAEESLIRAIFTF